VNVGSGIVLIMPLCDGRPPDGVCPDRKNDRSVVLCQGDLMLCEGCEHDRFPDCSRKSLKKKKAQSTASSKPNNTVSNRSQDAATIPVGASASAGNVTNSESEMVELSRRVEQLTATVNKQNETITRLSTQLQFVLSFLDIQQTENNRLELSSSAWPTVAEAALRSTNNPPGPSDQTVHNNPSPVTSFADIVTRTVQTQEKQKREELMAAVYIEQKKKAKRASSFVISGLPPDSMKDDNELVVELCRSELNIDVDISSTKRVGRPRDVKPQLLMVNLRTEADAQSILGSARQLRKSQHTYIKENVYINANLTPAEAKAAYELRQRRRQAAAAARQHNNVDFRDQDQQFVSVQRQQQPQQQRQHNIDAGNGSSNDNE